MGGGAVHVGRPSKICSFFRSSALSSLLSSSISDLSRLLRSSVFLFTLSSRDWKSAKVILGSGISRGDDGHVFCTAPGGGL